MEIRSMTTADLPAVLAIENLSFALPCSPEAFEYELTQNHLAHYLVLEQEGQIRAYGGIWLILEESHVINVAVHPDFRGQGWGRVIFEQMMQFSQEQGAEIIWLEVRPSNQTARNLYTSLGFQPIGLRKKYYSDNEEDAIVMAKKFDI